MQGRVLIVAGSDSGGGAGIQADLKTVNALGAFAMTAVTALTAQDTNGVHGIHKVPLAFVRQQMELVLADIGADVVKTGMLLDAETIELVTDVLQSRAPGIPVVVDPVMVATGGGHRLLESDGLAMLKRRLLVSATVLTPNLPEAELLAGMAITDLASLRQVAEVILTLGVPAVLLKGGHLPGPELYDVLATSDGIEVFVDARIAGTNTHGTGCTLASAIAAGLAQKLTLRDAVIRARRFVRRAIEQAPGLGHGHGPLNHAVTVDLARLG